MFMTICYNNAIFLYFFLSLSYIYFFFMKQFWCKNAIIRQECENIWLIHKKFMLSLQCTSWIFLILSLPPIYKFIFRDFWTLFFRDLCCKKISMQHPCDAIEINFQVFLFNCWFMNIKLKYQSWRWKQPDRHTHYIDEK